MKPKGVSTRRQPPAAFQPPTPVRLPLPTTVAASAGSHDPALLTGFAYAPMSGGIVTDSSTKKSLDRFNPLGFADGYKSILSSPQLSDHRPTTTGCRPTPGSTIVVDNEDVMLLAGFFRPGTPTQSLNRATILMIFALLSGRDRRKARLVCKDWAALLQDDRALVSV